MPSPPSLSLSLSSSSFRLGSLLVLHGEGGDSSLVPPQSTSFPLFCQGIDTDRLSGLIPGVVSIGFVDSC